MRERAERAQACAASDHPALDLGVRDLKLTPYLTASIAF